MVTFVSKCDSHSRNEVYSYFRDPEDPLGTETFVQEMNLRNTPQTNEQFRLPVLNLRKQNVLV